ncbi:ABC transporter ATP-binding protein [Gemmobacter fulvus]|uniref:ABC transporter ATP-binding protein n=1 Tax=Gemmobacter fulvus TaxID=2840474 RepID=UPI0027967AE1|nr:ABC transporter ATP-binding protein [Gemmobacter fulvus]MDQ1850744.1 ABC transporter ATP-binding protein [Gemmobacter fulvus]
MLSVNGISSFYGRVQVLHDVSLTVAASEIHVLLGRNGAGKTTLLKSIMGLVETRSGEILIDGVDLRKEETHNVPRNGVAYVPQGRGLFRHLTVAENLQMGMHVNNSDQETLDWALDLFPILKERANQMAHTLSGGEQQMLATARAICTRPKILLLDEPSEGVMPRIVDQMLDAVASLKQHGMSVLLVEQKIEAALRLADRVTFIEHGKIRHESDPATLSNDPEILGRYLGVRRK